MNQEDIQADEQTNDIDKKDELLDSTDIDKKDEQETEGSDTSKEETEEPEEQADSFSMQDLSEKPKEISEAGKAHAEKYIESLVDKVLTNELTIEDIGENPATKPFQTAIQARVKETHDKYLKDDRLDKLENELRQIKESQVQEKQTKEIDSSLEVLNDFLRTNNLTKAQFNEDYPEFWKNYKKLVANKIPRTEAVEFCLSREIASNVRADVETNELKRKLYIPRSGQTPQKPNPNKQKLAHINSILADIGLDPVKEEHLEG